jgi:RimJ/RimL family protein N-acetyltransferase
MRPFDQLRLITERLILRPFKPTDAGDLFAMFADPEVMRYWSSLPWTSIDQSHEMIAKDREAMPKGGHLRLGIELAGTGDLIGSCSVFGFDEQNKRAMLGYGMAKAHWGNGYMHEALCAVLDFAFGTLNLHRLEADIDPRNLGSAKSLERLGFVKEGHLRERWIVGDEVSDSSIYGLLGREWKARPR